jgi:RNA polymerase sigma-70 factor (ECF subfamily)
MSESTHHCGQDMDEPLLRDAVRRGRSGDPDAVEAVLAEFRPRIHRYCLTRLGDELAEDVTQEACLALANALPTYEERGVPFSSFVFGIAANKVSMARRSLARAREFAGVVPDTASAEPTPEQRAVTGDDLSRALAPLGGLPERQREILLLRVVDGLSADEVAGLLGMTPTAVRVAQHRALRSLRRRLEEDAS